MLETMLVTAVKTGGRGGVSSRRRWWALTITHGF
jgi:hypothetical protein